MENLKETTLAWIRSSFLLTFTFVGILSLNSFSSQKYVIQIAASKTPIDVTYLQKKFRIDSPIIEIRSSDWFRYVTGEFALYSEALEYAEILKNKGLKDVFPRNVKTLEGYPVPTQDSVVIDTSGFANSRTKQESDSMVMVNGVSRQDSIKEEPSTLSENTKDNNSWILSLLFKGRSNPEILERLNYLCDHYLPSFLFTPAHRTVRLIVQFPSVLLLILLIVVFILNLASVLVILYISNIYKNRRERHINQYKKIYEEALLSYFFGLADWEATFTSLKYISEPLNRKILVSILLSVQENLKGGIDKDIPEIFVRLGLQNDAMKLATSKFYYNKIEGIRRLTYLYPDGAMKIIPKYLNANNDMVRAEAQAAYVRLHHNEPFGFFGELKKPFTRWTQLTAFHLLRLYNLNVGSFARYLNSSHTNVRNFCLRMIIYFQQLEDAPEVFRMIGSKVEITRWLAYRAINDLRLFDGKDLIKERFPYEPEKNRIEIIRAFRNIGSNEDFEFLLTVFRNGTVSEKTEACRSLYFVNADGKKLVESLESEPELEVGKFIAHITDPRN